LRALLWLAAWSAVIALAQVAPLGVALALAVAVFAAQVLAAPGRSCHLPGSTGRLPPGCDRSDGLRRWDDAPPPA
jgi:hypothetical protein